MGIKRLIRYIFHPTTIKIVGLLCIVAIFFLEPTFAQTTDTDAMETTKNILSNILSICSRGWIILAILAGKLMTNDWVYASIIHMDVYLRKIWNIMKNFANFALIAIVLVNIVKNLLGKKDMDIKSIITKTLIAGILIQASRFLVGAIVDISTVATAAVGSFPSSFLKSDARLQKQIKTSLAQTPKEYKVNLNDALKTIDVIGTGTADTSERGDILPTYNSVSGPLIYLGFSVFKFQNYLNVDEISGTTEISIAFLLRVVLILMFTIGLALLFIANIIRVAFLWIFIIGAPLIILSRIFFKDEGLGAKSSGGIGKYLKFSVMINLIFKPVIFVAGFSFIIILVASIQNIMQGTLPQSIHDVEISLTTGGSKMVIDNITSIEIEETGIFGNDPITQNIDDIGKTVFVNLILFFMTIFLMWWFIKISLTAGDGPISDVMKPVTKWIEDTVKTLPLLPLGGGASIVQAQQFIKSNKKKTLEGLGISPEGKFGSLENGSFTTNEEKFRDFLNEKMGLQKTWKTADYKRLEKIAAGNEYSTFFDTTKTLAQEREGGINITNSSRQQAFKALVSIQGKATNFGLPQWTSGQSADDYFNKLKDHTVLGENVNGIRKLYELLGGQAASGKSPPTTYDELKNITFYPGSKK